MIRRAAPWIAVLALACAKAPPPDTDATPSGATPLELATPREDSLQCGEHDCADWYRVRLPKAGKLEVQLRQQPGSSTGRVSLTLTDAEGQTLARDDAAGRTQLTLPYAVVAFFNPDQAPPPVPAVRKPAPPKQPPKPAPPQFETRRGEVLEVRDGGMVLLDMGTNQGLKKGMRGRLLANGKPAAKLDVVEVFADGAIARVSEGGVPGIGATAEIELR